MGTRFQKLRFHIDFGPKELFDRVLFKMSEVSSIKITKHALERVSGRNIPDFVLNNLVHFSTKNWQLKTAEVRADSGKFVNSTWEMEYEGQKYWITIGFGNVLETIVIKDGSGKGNVVTDGNLYDFVQKVNKDLQNGTSQCP